ncbi:MAG: DUF4340 domain-containing protein [Proteobacteria bacterium]|nr:DUF4340 domain-containing protein [Pseudomonadota bacterium]
MNAKTLYLLVGATAIALAAAFWITSANAPVREESAKDTFLMPGLREELNAVDAFTIKGAGGKTLLELRRSGAEWRVAQRANYPADVGKLREYLFKLADAKVLDAKTSNPQRYAELGVEDPIDPQAKSLLVALGGVHDQPNLIVGLYNGQGEGGTFVRREGEKQSVLASGNLLVEKDPATWIRHELIDIDAAKIREVRLTDLDGKVVRIHKERASDANFMLADLPKGREPASESIANGLGVGLSNLRADDVVSTHDVVVPDKVYKVRYVDFDGTIIDVIAWDVDGKPHVQFVASNDVQQIDADIVAAQAREKSAYGAAVATAKLKVVESKGDDAAIAKAEADVPKPASVLDADKDRADRLAIANKTVESLNKKLGGWTYIVPEYVFSNFHKRIDDLLKPLEVQSAADAKGGKPTAPILPSARQP